MSNFQRLIGNNIEFNPDRIESSLGTVKIGQLNNISNIEISNNNWSGLSINTTGSNDGNTELLYIPTHTNQIIMGYNRNDLLTNSISNSLVREINIKTGDDLYINMTESRFNITSQTGGVEISGNNFITNSLIDISELNTSNIVASNIFDLSDSRVRIENTLVVNGDISSQQITDLSNAIDDLSEGLQEGGILTRFETLSGDIRELTDYLNLGYFGIGYGGRFNNTIPENFGTSNDRRRYTYSDRQNTNNVYNFDLTYTSGDLSATNMAFIMVKSSGYMQFNRNAGGSDTGFFFGVDGFEFETNGNYNDKVRIARSSSNGVSVVDITGFMIDSNLMALTVVPIIEQYVTYTRR
jgi:hypothetical protein